MTNLQAALGVAQLERLEDFIEVKARNYELYKNRIVEIDGLSLLGFNEDCRPNYWFYSLVVDEEKYGLDRDHLLKKLNDQKIQTRPVWGLIHEQLPYREQQAYKVEKAYDYLGRILNIPCSTNLTEEEVAIVIHTLENTK